MQKRHKQLITLTLIVSITALVLLFFNEQNERKNILKAFLREELSISSSSYTTNTTINKFGYMYTLKFNDEPGITYDFFVKRNSKKEYLINYYGHDPYDKAALRENKFMVLNH